MTEREDEHSAVLCEHCYETALHFDCMTMEEQLQWDEEDEWNCTQCDSTYDLRERGRTLDEFFLNYFDRHHRLAGQFEDRDRLPPQHFDPNG